MNGAWTDNNIFSNEYKTAKTNYLITFINKFSASIANKTVPRLIYSHFTSIEQRTRSKLKVYFIFTEYFDIIFYIKIN